MAAQIRAARALIGWSRERLSEASGVPVRTLARMETENGPRRSGALATVCCALKAAGVEFIEPNGGGAGVRLRSSGR